MFVRRREAVREVIFPFYMGLLSLREELFGLPRVDIKSGREAEGIVRVVVVDCPVGVHIHEIVGVARIRGTEPPISGDAEYNLITRRIKLAPYRSA